MTSTPPILTGEIVASSGRSLSSDRITQFDRYTEEWLANRRFSANTRSAYRRNLARWRQWLTERGLDALAVKFTHVNTWARELEEQPRFSETGKELPPYAPASISQMLSAVSKWYVFLVQIDAIDHNPLLYVDRPDVDSRNSTTTGLTDGEVARILDAAETSRTPQHIRDRAIITTLADLGVRVSELCGFDIEKLSYQRGRRIVEFTGKRGKLHKRVLDPGTAETIDLYLAYRARLDGCEIGELRGALFVTDTGRRLDRREIAGIVTRLARRAHLPHADRITPHSFRHAFVTSSRSAGIPREDIQEALQHEDARTTDRYDRDAGRLDRDPSHRVWELRDRLRQHHLTPSTTAAEL